MSEDDLILFVDSYSCRLVWAGVEQYQKKEKRLK